MSEVRVMNYVLKVVACEAVVAAVLGVFLCLLADRFSWSLRLNFGALISAFVNLNAGIIIAIFLALFNSANKNIDSFKKFINATKQIYMLFLINCAVACSVSLFVTNTESGEIMQLLKDQQSANYIFSSVSVVFTSYNLYLVYKMLTIAFRDAT